ncbi:hypothetical protein [Algiphilus sp.]|uniref:HAD family hydrolase n=2 Tax=Algiphilus sp. TaxID=1872431 RepID=UPI0032F00D1B|nr:hypothetical protein [Hyphomonas sp.]
MDLSPLQRVIADGASRGLIVVASGGSTTSASLAADLHMAAVGNLARAMSPLEFRALEALANSNVWLISAGGENHDILDAARHAFLSGAHSVTAIVASRQSKLSDLVEQHESGRVITLELTCGKDGFLATNSLWGTCLLLVRAFRAVFSSAERGVEAPDAQAMITWARNAVTEQFKPCSNLVLIGDPSTLVGARDLTMRAEEAALASIWATDLRNLGHGRHYWFAAHGRNACAYFLVSEEYTGFANKCAELIGTGSPATVVTIPGDSDTRMLSAIAFSLYAAGALGAHIRRDPGRPGVPKFGESLYNLRMPYQERAASYDREQRIIAAKLGMAPTDALLERDAYEQWKLHLRGFEERLRGASVRALIFDYDGTLIDTTRRFEPLAAPIVEELIRVLNAGQTVGIATGRGDSCGEALRAALPKHLWAKVTIGYYNGSLIRRLDDTSFLEKEASEQIMNVRRRIEDIAPSGRRASIRTYEKQCSVTFYDGRSVEQGWMEVSAVLASLIDNQMVKVWKSSHSVDIVLSDVSKTAVVDAIAQQLGCTVENIVCIGDQGRWPGNDTELLGNPLSLSADRCSFTPDRCWNLAGFPRRQLASTLAQLRLFDGGPGRPFAYRGELSE